MKKVLALVLVAAMAVGMGVTTFAAGVKKLKVVDNIGLGYCAAKGSNFTSTDFNRIDNGTEIDVGTLTPVADAKTPKLYLYLAADMFNTELDGSGDAPTGTTKGYLASSDITASKLTVRTQVKAGSKLFSGASIDKKEGRIELAFAKEWVSTTDQDFEIVVYLNEDGKRSTNGQVTVYGTMENELIEVDDYDYVELGVGVYAEALEFINKIEVDLGNGVSIFTKFFKGKKYYGSSSRDADESDDVVFAKYPDVDNVVTLKTVGLNSTGDIVKLDTDFSGYYVYDANMNYLGQSNEMLPYSTKYYLSNKKLDIVDDAAGEPAEEEPSEDDGDEPSYTDDGENPNMGGDGAISNANANPGTGR